MKLPSENIKKASSAFSYDGLYSPSIKFNMLSGKCVGYQMPPTIVKKIHSSPNKQNAYDFSQKRVFEENDVQTPV